MTSSTFAKHARIFPFALAALLGTNLAAHTLPPSLHLSRTVSVGRASTLVLHNRVGSVRIEGVAGTKTLTVRVALRPRCSHDVGFFGFFHWLWSHGCPPLPPHPIVAVGRKDNRIALVLRDAEGTKLRHVHADWTVILPENTAVSLREGVGKIALTNLDGDLDLKVGVGKVTLRTGGALRTTVTDGVGSVHLENVTLPPHGNMRIHDGVGTIRIALAATPSPNVPRTIDVHAGVGTVSVRGLPCRLGRVSVASGVGHISTDGLPPGIRRKQNFAGSSLEGGNGGGLVLKIRGGTRSVRLGWNRAQCSPGGVSRTRGS